MISPICFEKEWIEDLRKQKGLGRLNPPLLEKMIHALYLLQNLKKQGLDFVFKGGTSLVLLLENANRFSVDIDIIADKPYDNPSTRSEIEDLLDRIVEDSNFQSWKLDDARSYQEGVPKAHYKLEYQPKYDPSGYILLDILFERNYYPNLIEVPVQAKWIESEEIISVTVPDIDSITGDKLTAFAPNTTGIKYRSDKELEIIKQLFDIGHLFDRVDSLDVLARSFEAFISEEAGYRGLSIGSEEVLSDIVETSKTIARRDKNIEEPYKSNFSELKKGILQFGPFLISGSFHLDEAITASAKAAYLAAKLSVKDHSTLKRFGGDDISGLIIEDPDWNFLNKLKKLPDKAAFYYWYQTVALLTA